MTILVLPSIICISTYTTFMDIVREARNDSGRGGRGGGRGFGRGRGGSAGGYRRDFSNDENSYGNSGPPANQGAPEDADMRNSYDRRGGYGGARGLFRGGRRGGFSNGDVADGERPRRPFERRSGTGHG